MCHRITFKVHIVVEDVTELKYAYDSSRNHIRLCFNVPCTTSKESKYEKSPWWYCVTHTFHHDIKVFWYDTPDQVALLFENYIELMRRNGFQPPRYIVEANIREIADRIDKRSKVTRLVTIRPLC